jgi:hypothetical protein
VARSRRWHDAPARPGSKQVEGFLTILAAERKVSATTHNQATSALLFLYREVRIDFSWLTKSNRPTRTHGRWRPRFVYKC